MCLVKWIFEWRNFDCSFLSWAAAAAEQTLLHTPGRNMRPRRKWRCKAGQRRQRQQLRTCKSSANLAFSPRPHPQLRINASRLGVVCVGQQLQFHFRSLAFYSLFWPSLCVCSRRSVYFREISIQVFSAAVSAPASVFVFFFFFGCCTDFRADTVKFLHKLFGESVSN